ncbi:LPS-assembly protein LptD [Undibacterium arcticum]
MHPDRVRHGDPAAVTGVRPDLRQKKVRVDDKNAPATISAEQMTGRPDRDINLENDVEITRGQTTVNSDRAVFHQEENAIDASGNVRVKRFGDQFTGDALELNLDSGVGFMSHPTYKLEINNGQGRADRIDFESEDRATVVDGTYSTCEGPDPDWYLKTGKLHLDMGRELGTASKTVIYFKGVPILGTPAMSFPLTGERKSGVLPPTLGITSKGGVEFSLPYYFNIAPNRDLTLYPKLISKRGLQLGANGRYLGESYAGETNIETLYDDRQTKTNRYAYSSTHTQTLAPGLLFGWNLNGASDNDYPNDFCQFDHCQLGAPAAARNQPQLYRRQLESQRARGTLSGVAGYCGADRASV